MKRLLVLFFAYVTLAGVARSEPQYDDYGRRDAPRGSFGVFYSSLASSGEWIDFNFGYAWRPYRVSHGWRPYLYGRWVWSDYGWYWVSDEPFGWATYHYGRWYYDDYYGWIWTPGDVWAPAWVEWRYDDEYLGWAPLPPYANFDVSVGVTFREHWVAPYNYWNFVPCRYFVGTRVVDYVQPVERTRRIFGNTRSVLGIRFDNDRVINGGIDVGFVERRANMRVDKVDVIAGDRGDGERFVREGNRQRVEVFRPRLDAQIRGNESRPLNARRAEHPITFDGAGDHRSEGTFTRPDRSPDPRRDTRIQEHPPIERAPSPDRRVETARPQERRVEPRRDTRIQERPPIERAPSPDGRVETARPQERRVDPRRDTRIQERGQIERAPAPGRRVESPRPPDRRISREQQVPPGFQEKRMPAVRPAPGERGNARREAPRERAREKRDEPPRGRRQ